MFKSFQEEKGFALALVLLITTLVLITVLEFNYEMRVDASIAGNYRDSFKALYVAKGGINAAIALLKQDFRSDREKNAFIDSFEEDWAKPELTLQIGEGIVSGKIIDECGKVDLNEFLVEGEDEDEDEGKKKPGKKEGEKTETKEEQKENVVRKIFDNLEVNYNNTEELIESIKDWTGESFDDNPSIGAYYQSLPSPYESKIASLDDITELLLVKGINRNLFYQIKEKNVSEGEKPVREEEGKKENKENDDILKAFPNLFTVYSGHEGKININTAPKEILLALHPDIDEESVNEIIERRADEPFESIDDVKKVSSTLADIFEDNSKKGKKGIRNLITVKSSYFRIIAHGTVNDVTKTIEAVVLRDPKPENNGKISIVSWAEF